MTWNGNRSETYHSGLSIYRMGSGYSPVDSWVANWVASNGYSKEPAEVTEHKIFEKQVPEEYQEFSDVFAKKDFEKLPECRSWDHAIELAPGFKPVDCKVSEPPRTNCTRRISRGKPTHQTDKTVKITNGFAILLQEETRWFGTETHTGLQKA
jgi:hypothetical protein